MKILVAGSAGFIGSHLVERLLSDGNEVIGLDNLSTGSLTNVERFSKNPRFEFIRHDVVDKLEVSCDGIYNLACPASPVAYQSNPLQTFKTSVYGALNLLELATKNNIRILQASTSEVYGDPLVNPQSELYWGNVNPIGIRACYDEGKRAAETLFSDYHRVNSTDVRIARIFNTFGPNMAMDDGRVMSNFICQAIKNIDITIYGNGKQTRSFCYIDDLVEGLIRLFSADIGPEPVNLGNPAEITIQDLAREVINVTNCKSRIVFKELPEDDPKIRNPDITTAKTKLGWEPKISRAQGIIDTYSYFKSVLN